VTRWTDAVATAGASSTAPDTEVVGSSPMKDYSETIFNLVEYEVWCNLQSSISFPVGLTKSVGAISDSDFALRIGRSPTSQT
jgi:hypothetical protein